MHGPSAGDILLDVKNLTIQFKTRQGVVRAVDDVTFQVNRGEIVGLVGESGCGKSVTGLSILRQVPQPAGRIVGGEIHYDHENLLKKSEEAMRKIRGNRIAMVTQDAMVSLNPLFKIGYQIAEVLKTHNRVKGAPRQQCARLLNQVGVPSPERRLENYPFQFSGGMCQRVLIAMGISCDPDLIIADEPTTALDVTIQAQVLELLKEIQRTLSTSIIFITHDLGIVAQLCSRVMVMYAGRIVEKADIITFFNKPAHPYSVGLIRSVPVLGKRVERLYSIEGQPPNFLNLPLGCRFAPRCLHVRESCRKAYPPEIQMDHNHSVACWLYTGK